MKYQLQYRADIDALRAIAVLWILLFHAGFAWAGGGYVGVDVFLVISGYLITRNILSDIDAGTFSLKAFYRRRVRRILPALIATLAMTMIAGSLILSPPDLEYLAQSALYALASLANVFFWQGAGYFDIDAEQKLLLHTWSLSLEEQFYLVWPSLLLLLTRFRRRVLLLVLLVLIGVVSIGAAESLSYESQATAFFLLPFRAGEFVIGALGIWLLAKRPDDTRTIWMDLTCIVGLILLVGSLIWFGPESRFPGLSVLPPCLGALCLIYAGDRSRVGRWLASPPLVKLGVISYSVYLVHWPLFGLYRYVTVQEWQLGDQMMLLAISLLLGWASWRWVEQSFRLASKAPERGQRSAGWLWVGAALTAGLAATAWAKEGWPSRYAKDFYLTTDEMLQERARYWDGFGSNEESKLKINDSDEFVLVMGNSHAQDLVYALRQNGFPDNIVYLGVPYTCYNFGTPGLPQFEQQCAEAKASNLGSESWRTAKAVFLHEDWKAINLPELLDLIRQLRQLTSAPMYLFGPRVSYSKRVTELARAHGKLSGFNEYSQGFSNFDERHAYSEALREALQTPEFEQLDVHYIDTIEAQCKGKLSGCKVLSTRNGKFLYFDMTHFTQQGAAEFGARLKRIHPELFDIKADRTGAAN